MGGVAPELSRVEQAVLLADFMDQPERAHALLSSAELQLRKICKKTDASPLALMAYRHCLHELGRLTDKKMSIPSGVLKLEPMEIRPLLDVENKMILLLVMFTAGSLEMPIPFENYESGPSSYAGAVAEHSPVRTIRAAFAYVAGVSALQTAQRPDLALKHFRLSASVDTWLRPVAAAMAAKAAPELADDIPKQAARDDAEYQSQFEALRKQLAGSQAAQPSR